MSVSTGQEEIYNAKLKYNDGYEKWNLGALIVFKIIQKTELLSTGHPPMIIRRLTHKNLKKALD